MEYSVTKKEDVKHVTFYGNLAPSARSQFLAIAESMDGSLEKKWVLNIQEFDFIDSSGIGMLIELQQKANDKGVSLAISGAKPAVKKLFKLTKFEQMYDIID